MSSKVVWPEGFIGRWLLACDMYQQGVLTMQQAVRVVEDDTYYPDVYDDEAWYVGQGVGPTGGYDTLVLPPPLPPMRPGDPKPGRCRKCGNERIVLDRIDPTELWYICRLCGKAFAEPRRKS